MNGLAYKQEILEIISNYKNDAEMALFQLQEYFKSLVDNKSIKSFSIRTYKEFCPLTDNSVQSYLLKINFNINKYRKYSYYFEI